MIRVRKGAAPRVLRDKGQAQIQADCAAFDGAPDEYRSGRKRFAFDGALYGHPTVKKALVAAQHGKCCYCESKFDHVAYGDVEHFRPKGGYQQTADQPLQHPGYYWLAYEWRNLFASCGICNQQYKRNLFPLEDPEARAKSHHDNVARERPSRIDPAVDDPARYLSFRKEILFPLNDNSIGASTIDGLGLNRERIAERRREHYRNLEMCRDVIAALSGSAKPEDQALVGRAKALLDEAVQDSAEYAAMARALLSASG